MHVADTFNFFKTIFSSILSAKHYNLSFLLQIVPIVLKKVCLFYWYICIHGTEVLVDIKCLPVVPVPLMANVIQRKGMKKQRIISKTPPFAHQGTEHCN